METPDGVATGDLHAFHPFHDIRAGIRVNVGEGAL
jgi:hypothetical protein